MVDWEGGIRSPACLSRGWNRVPGLTHCTAYGVGGDCCAIILSRGVCTVWWILVGCALRVGIYFGARFENAHMLGDVAHGILGSSFYLSGMKSRIFVYLQWTYN